MSRTQSPQRPSAHAGFTLVELLVAMAIMAILAALAWQGVDSMARTREQVQTRLDASLTLNTALAQWEADLQNLLQDTAVPALAFDGARLRLTRSTPGGAQVVVWSVQAGRWWRWAGPPTRSAQELTQQWQNAQQLRGSEAGHVSLAEGAQGWQLFFFRGNAWSNAQSSGDLATASKREKLPTGVRMVLTLSNTGSHQPSGRLTRDILIPGAEP